MNENSYEALSSARLLLPKPLQKTSAITIIHFQSNF